MWERGVAYKKHGELYQVLSVDLGTRHQVALSELRPLPDSAKSLPACAIQVTCVGDPDPGQVFGPPRSGSISQRYVSGSFPFLKVLSGLK
jgi:hypothetical protein